ncbi:MAG: hypothetical protein NTV61_06545 [Candidatus Bathyarchaeota archaeon]|nr:hypothetical protein [Candidatus Bathyarchaeota archaeon]
MSVGKNKAENPQNNMGKAAGRRMLVVYYSKGGNTRAVAEAISKRTGADLEEVEAKDGGNDTHRYNPSDYSLVIVGTPVNGFSPSKPIKDYFASTQGKLPEVAVFATYSLWPAGTLSTMERLAGKKPLVSAKFKSRDIKLGHVSEEIEAFVDALRPRMLNG